MTKDVKNLIKRTSEGTTSFICAIDGKVLVEVDDNGYRSMTSCAHFQWYELTKACFYMGVGDISPEELQFLRKNSVLRLHEGMFIHLLAPTKV